MPAWLLAKILMRGSCDIEEFPKANLQSSMELSISIEVVSRSLLSMCVKNWGLGMLREGWDPTFPPHSVHAYIHVCCGSGISSHMLCCSIYRCRSHCLASIKTPKCPRSMGVSLNFCLAVLSDPRFEPKAAYRLITQAPKMIRSTYQTWASIVSRYFTDLLTA
jgi:hypothetical protein